MTCQAVQKSACLSDFVELNKNLQQAVGKAIQEMEFTCERNCSTGRNYAGIPGNTFYSSLGH